MQPKNPICFIDLDLVDEVVNRIPEGTWSVVKDRLVTDLVDSMPTEIIKRLTGNPSDDDGAQEKLTEYYAPDERNKDIIVDSFKILSEEQTLYSLESLQLDKIIQP